MDTYGSDITPAFGLCFFLVYMIVILGLTVLTVVAFYKIFSKAGYHWAMGLLMLVPIANIIMPLILAFGQWPIHRELNAYRQAQQAASLQPKLPTQSDFRNV